MLSTSNIKHDAIVDSGIPIVERMRTPEGMFVGTDMILDDSRGEINDAEDFTSRTVHTTES